MNVVFQLIVILGLIGCQSKGSDERGNLLKPNGEREIVVVDFSKPFSLSPLPKGWRHKTFWFTSPMDISFVSLDNTAAARFETNKGASMLIRDTEIPLSEYPILKWKWRVEKSIQSTVDERTHKGDDSPARIYVSFSVPGEKSRSFEIFWALKMNKGEKKIIKDYPHYAARGAGDQLNTWYSETVDLQKIYNEFFPDKKPATLEKISFFCDSDNTKKSSIAYFSGLTLSKGTQD